MNLFIVIAVHNRKQITLKCLDQLHQQSYKNFKVVITDDGSTDGTSEAVQQAYPETVLIKGTGNWWWTKSVNEGIQYALQAGATHLLMLNDDTIFDKEYLATLISDIHHHNEPLLIGSLNLTLETPHKVYFSGASALNALSFKYTRYHPTMSQYSPEKFKGYKDSVYLPARGMLVSAEVFRKIGVLDDEKFPQYFSDIDFSMKAVKAGFKTIVSYNAILYTPVNSTGSGDFYKKEAFQKFIKSFSNKYSKRDLGRSFQFVKNHAPRYLVPISFFMYQCRILGSYFKSRLTQYR